MTGAICYPKYMEINVNKDYVELFIGKIENLMEQSDEEEYIQDEAGTYLKISYLRDLILETIAIQ